MRHSRQNQWEWDTLDISSTWIASWKSRSHGDAPGAEASSAEIPNNGGAADPASSSARVLNLAGLDPRNAFLEERARAGQGYKALRKNLENELGLTCSEQSMRTGLTNQKSALSGYKCSLMRKGNFKTHVTPKGWDVKGGIPPTACWRLGWSSAPNAEHDRAIPKKTAVQGRERNDEIVLSMCAAFVLRASGIVNITSRQPSACLRM